MVALNLILRAERVVMLYFNVRIGVRGNAPHPNAVAHRSSVPKNKNNFLSVFCGSPQTPRLGGIWKGKEFFGFAHARTSRGQGA